MQKIWDEIVAMKQRGVVHRRGFNINEISCDEMLLNARHELDELIAEPDNPDELGDTVSILIHYCIRKGWSLEKIEELVLAKFKERFS